MSQAKVFPRKVYGRITGRPMNFSFVDDMVAGSARPMSKKEVDWIRQRGIKAILSLTENPIDPTWVEGLDYKSISMVDHSTPSLEQLHAAVDYLISQTKMNRPVLVHCLAGKGRTGCVLASYLMVKDGCSAQDSIARLRAMRPGSVERKQVSVVEEFSESLKKKDGRS
ncbi:MAG TPA: dual specificity protein phosphatase family protein [Nitrososphaerales archaeon]|nr:dual specificity protein phosphatase family protein [Nitrososphaerales archaeon]